MSAAEEIRGLPAFARAAVFRLVTAEAVRLMEEIEGAREHANGVLLLWDRLAEPTGDPSYPAARDMLRLMAAR